MMVLLATLLFSGEVVVGPGKTRTLDVKPSPVPVRLSATFDAASRFSRVRLVLLTNGSAVMMTPYRDSGEITVMLDARRSYRLVVDNRPGETAAANVGLNVHVSPEQSLPASTRTRLSAGSILLFLALALWSGVTLWRKTRPSPAPYS